ncbi:MAG: hypothetical protein KF687_04490 [Cyclobacteriaceae bacterium]|nr:hypothetical protein [Cyclobacteriaceae bacterium]
MRKPSSHIRSEGDKVTEAIDEAISIGEVANMPVQISHFKVTYKPNWGRSVHTLAQVEAARLRGIDVTIDQYPYVASSTTLSTTVPSWVFPGGRDSVLWRSNDKPTRQKIKKEMTETLKSKKLKNYDYALIARYALDNTYNGKTITDVNKLKGRKTKPMEEAETILDLIASTDRVQMVYFSMDEADLRRILQYPFNMFASDAGMVQACHTYVHTEQMHLFLVSTCAILKLFIWKKLFVERHHCLHHGLIFAIGDCCGKVWRPMW